MYILKNNTQEIASSPFEIIYYEDQLAWLVINVAWYCDQYKQYTVEQIPDPEPTTNNQVNVIG